MKKINIIMLIFLDILVWFGCSILSYLLIFGKTIDLKYLPWIGLHAIVNVIFFAALKLYNSLWRYAGIFEFIRIVFVSVVIILVDIVIAALFTRLDVCWAIVNGLCFACFVFGIRFVKRFIISLQNNILGKSNNKSTKVMVIGAGSAGLAIIKDIIETKSIQYNVVCVIDDDVNKVGKYILNVPIVGSRDKIIESCEKYDVKEIIIALPSIGNKEKSEIINICKETSCKVRIIPGIYQLVSGSVGVSALRDVEISDLLGRDPIKVNIEDIMGYIEGEVVLITGGGGSIGSELSRQVATHNPKQLIILDIYENNAYEIEQELRRKLPNLNLLTLIASIRDKGKIENVFKTYKPTIVFNAAAHKHVPLMETSPNEAIKNNVFGTLNVARMADKYGTKRFVQISTDKAVNPTNIMGASKRICEMIIQTIGKHSKTCEFVAVRFGNVLGSNGSVIPLFKKQMAEGGPVTVTHKDIIRYFMTIPEAVSLVLQAGSYAKGGEIFVLDMGEPVKIYDLAVNLIKLSGFIPNVTMPIKVTGLRPGEKLYEERLMEEEGLSKTANGLISIAKPIDLDEDKLFASLDELYKEAYNETEKMKELVQQLVPTYKIDK